MAEQVFFELTIIIGMALLGAGLMRFLKQPVILGYILAGILVTVLQLSASTHVLEGFAELGLALLLFMVGLGLNPHVIKSTGKVSLFAGLGQVIFTSIIGFVLSRMLGYETTTSIFLAVALTFSSTIIVMKILSDKGVLETLSSRIAVGILIVQDIVAALILMFLASRNPGEAVSSGILTTLLTGVGLLLGITIFGIYILPHITKKIARNQELLVLFSIAWLMILGSLFAHFGFSIEIGALLAGVSLSVSPFRQDISSRLKPIRDFFLALFFIVLGSQLSFGAIGGHFPAIVALSLFVLIGNPLITVIIMGAMNYTKRTSFMVGLTVAQVSEFSLILIALGVKTGYITAEIQSVFTIIALVTIAGSTYFMIHEEWLYRHFSRFLKPFERKGTKVDEHEHQTQKHHDAILFGYNRIGFSVLRGFKNLNASHLVVDYNPDTIALLEKQGVECIYGDASDLEFLEEIGMKRAKMIISTIPDQDSNLLLLKRARKENPEVIVIAVAHHIDDAFQLYDAGASYVITPHFLSGTFTRHLIEEYRFDSQHYVEERKRHQESIRHRQELGQEHPHHERG